MSAVLSVEALSEMISSKSSKFCPSRASMDWPRYFSPLYTGSPTLSRGDALFMASYQLPSIRDDSGTRPPYSYSLMTRDLPVLIHAGPDTCRIQNPAQFLRHHQLQMSR